MGSIISYYMNSRPMQELEDYMNSYNSCIYPSFNDDNDDNNDNNDNDNDDNDNDDKKLVGDYYKLLIYIHDKNSELQNMYEESSKKHNEVVEKYMNESSHNLDDEENIIHCYDSGFDLFCPENIEYENKNKNKNKMLDMNMLDMNILDMYMLDHNISCAMTYKDKYVGYYLYMRSGTPVKTPLRLANNVGIIDSGYRGNIKACFDILKANNFKFEKGNRYIQICPPNIGLPMKVVIVDSFSMLGKKNNRNNGGFGSTGI